MKVALQQGDALIVLDMQVDFVSGSVAVPSARETVPVINRYMQAFRAHGLPIVAARDWHPLQHVSFRAQGGPWPPHCVAGTPGADFEAGLEIGPDVAIVSKGTARDRDAYSAFDATSLEDGLRRSGVRRLFVSGLATDYCVLATAQEALHHGFAVLVPVDAVRAMDREPGDGEVALRGMLAAGARTLRLEDLRFAVPTPQ